MYEELLVHDRTQGRLATPQLLRTCRQINDEAKGLLYISSSLTVNAKFFISDDVFLGGSEPAAWQLTSEDRPWCEWKDKSDVEKDELEAEGYVPPPSPQRNPSSSTGSDGTARCYKPCLLTGDLQRRAEPLTLREANKLWPSTLRDIPTLNINITLDLDPVFSTDGTVNDADFSGLNFFPYSLFSHLSTSTKSQRLVITLLNEAGCVDPEIQTYCYPLFKPPLNIALEFNDEVARIDSRVEILQDTFPDAPAIKNNILAYGVSTMERLETFLDENDGWRDYTTPIIYEARNAYAYLNRILETDDWGWVGVEDDLYCSKVVDLANEILANGAKSENSNQAWHAILTPLICDLETVVQDYWWTWGGDHGHFVRREGAGTRSLI